jgi:hypothetical protein
MDANSGGNWERLVEGNWLLQPGQEITNGCQLKTIAEDIYVSAIRPMHMPGAHHTTLSAAPGTAACSDRNGATLLYAGTLGTQALQLPPGVALKLTAGSTLILFMHTFNASSNPLSGTTGIEILRADPKDVVNEAVMFPVGPFQLTLPPSSETKVSAECTVSGSTNLVAMLPHMHTLGRHLKTTVTVGGSPVVVHDADYDFEEQRFVPFDHTIAVTQGDKIATECTFMNTTNATVTYGESTLAEMCFSMLYRYPLNGGGCL